MRNLIISEEFYIKFYHYQFSHISNAANYDTVILDNSLFTDSDDTTGCIYTVTMCTPEMSRAMLETCRGI
jgi:hypothetical protein